MNKTNASPRGASSAGCLAMTMLMVLIIAGAAILIAQHLKRERQAFERRQAERRAELVEDVKSGADGSRLTITDAETLVALASDPDCVANLKTLTLGMVDLSGDVAAASKLINVERITLYDCQGADNLLAAMKGSPVVEQIHVEVSRLSDEGVRLLATFPNLKKVRIEQVVNKARAELLRSTLPGVKVEIPFPEAAEPTR
ncbi:MAG TPA: hypothetical protein VF175_10510 [Lacipirellula sp.]